MYIINTQYRYLEFEFFSCVIYLVHKSVSKCNNVTLKDHKNDFGLSVFLHSRYVSRMTGNFEYYLKFRSFKNAVKDEFTYNRFLPGQMYGNIAFIFVVKYHKILRILIYSTDTCSLIWSINNTAIKHCQKYTYVEVSTKFKVASYQISCYCLSIFSWVLAI